MTAPRVSIVIPTYNQAALLAEALASVIGQSHQDWEAMIVNNHSDDDTIGTVEGFGDPRFRLVNFRNNGVIAASRNKGIELARGEWIAFLDSDDLWRPAKLARCLAGETDTADLISHREATFRESEVLSVSPHHRPDDASYRNLLFEGTCFSPSAALVRRSLIETVGGFSEDPALATCEDYDLWLSLVAAGARVRFVDEVLSDYRLHDSNASGAALRHMNAGLTAVDAHYRRLAPKRPLDGLRLRRRRAMIIYGAGRSLQKSGRTAEARGCFLRSLGAFPLYLRAAAFAAATLLPTPSQP